MAFHNEGTSITIYLIEGIALNYYRRYFKPNNIAKREA
jgi:hypothetical protein